MNKFIFTLFPLLLLAFVSNSQDFKIKGSDTIYPLMQSLSEVYTDSQDSNSRINVEGGGSGTGFKALISKEVHIAMASRKIKNSEKNQLKGAQEVVIALDALSIIVNTINPIEKLNKQQLKDIFTGKITNWKEVGGSDLPITVYTRFNNSGTYDFMIEKVMDNSEFSNQASAKASNAGIVQSVAENPAGIGFVGLAYVEEVVKPISISFSGEFFRPTFKNALDQTYPITRPLYIYYRAEETASVQNFVNFIIAPLGQKIVTHKGYIPIKF